MPGDLYFWEIEAATGMDWSNLALHVLCRSDNKACNRNQFGNGSRLNSLALRPFFRAVYTVQQATQGFKPRLRSEFRGVDHQWYSCLSTKDYLGHMPQKRLAVMHAKPSSEAMLNELVKAYRSGVILDRDDA